ncbi:neuroendocrine convertase 1-like [Alosa pseudoharengus]|uniref:neuroendocrine convertase 1-like n=1 Tax=Alosa pseudoharengus TaxID=34774 RepID=UPI003F888E00
MEPPAVLTLFWMLQWRYVTTGGQGGTEANVFYAVEMEGGIQAVQALAEQHGLRFISRVGDLEAHFTLRDDLQRSDRSALESALALTSGVKWVQRQKCCYRDKRAAIRRLDIMSHAKWPHVPESMVQRQAREGGGGGEEEEGLKEDVGALHFNDPLWPMQWELFNRGQFAHAHLDLNVMPVWQRNITGHGVVVTIIDDGLDHSNTDLRKNFEPFASFDLRGAHGLSHDPMPLRDAESGHGTRCAGEVAMEANNSYCGVGIAYNARVGGIRLLDGVVTDVMEASSLSFNSSFIDIYICSWGPRDDGVEMGGPAQLAEKALRLGAERGRGGKGNVFVWASGNGGAQGDHCGADGYINSIYTIAIGAITHTGRSAFYSEPCPATMAVTLTSGNPGILPVVTVSNLDDGCITEFAGTSSAAPIAAGVIALVLEANPDLTWRDIQHLIARTAKVPDPQEPGWILNGAGFHVHDRYGFGLLDAALMVQQALLLQSALPQRQCSYDMTLDPVRLLPSGGEVSVVIQSEACSGATNQINTLEHVQVMVSVSSVCRGDLSVVITSPSSTHSLLLGSRPSDASEAGLVNWTMMSVQFWGEPARGDWTLRVMDNRGAVKQCGRRMDSKETAGVLISVGLRLYGTYDPQRPPYEGPLHSFVSMGTSQPIPDSIPYLLDRSHPQALIQFASKLESQRRVAVDDIPALFPRQRKASQAQPLPHSPLHIEGTDGSPSDYQEMMWNTLSTSIKRTPPSPQSPLRRQKRTLHTGS